MERFLDFRFQEQMRTISKFHFKRPINPIFYDVLFLPAFFEAKQLNGDIDG